MDDAPLRVYKTPPNLDVIHAQCFMKQEGVFKITLNMLCEFHKMFFIEKIGAGR